MLGTPPNDDVVHRTARSPRRARASRASRHEVHALNLTVSVPPSLNLATRFTAGVGRPLTQTVALGESLKARVALDGAVAGSRVTERAARVDEGAYLVVAGLGRGEEGALAWMAFEELQRP